MLLYGWGVRLAAFWNPKAAQWVEGRKRLFGSLSVPGSGPVIWIHAASAGEFEQAKPVIERLKKEYPGHRVLVSFFSPSGYVQGKKYRGADAVTYLPLDTAANARRFLEAVNPVLVIFVKYDFWYHHLRAVSDRRIPLLLISAIFRPNQAFFRPWGGFYRRMLRLFTHLFVQDAPSLQLLQGHGLGRVSIGGDTRFDRVVAITGGPREVPPLLEAFAKGGGKKVIVAGSTWPEDEAALQALLQERRDVRLIIAPHEIGAGHIEGIEKIFPRSFRFSALNGLADGLDEGLRVRFDTADVLIIDHIGLLSRLYYYADITYVGGAFRTGLHNILEAAVWGKPVLFGPIHGKFREAGGLIGAGGAISVKDAEALKAAAARLLEEPGTLARMGESARNYVKGNTGATDRILQFIQANRLLTS